MTAHDVLIGPERVREGSVRTVAELVEPRRQPAVEHDVELASQGRAGFALQRRIQVEQGGFVVALASRTHESEERASGSVPTERVLRRPHSGERAGGAAPAHPPARGRGAADRSTGKQAWLLPAATRIPWEGASSLSPTLSHRCLARSSPHEHLRLRPQKNADCSIMLLIFISSPAGRVRPCLLLSLLPPALVASSPPPPTLTLAQAVAQARTASPLRDAAQSLALGSAEAARLAGRLLNPLLDVRVENATPFRDASLPLDVFAVLGQPIELAGKRGLRTDVADAERDVAGAQSPDRGLAALAADDAALRAGAQGARPARDPGGTIATACRRSSRRCAAGSRKAMRPSPTC